MTVTFFKDIEAEAAIIHTAGTYKQVGLAERDDVIYLKTANNAYVKVKHDRSTSKANIKVVQMSWSDSHGSLGRTVTGDLCRRRRKKSVALDEDRRRFLLGLDED